jgi:hypothetical protein
MTAGSAVGPGPTEVLDLQRAVGNRAVASAIQRQPAPAPAPAPAPTTAPPVAVNPLEDKRIAWIETLESPLRSTIDTVSDKELRAQTSKIEKELEKAKARVKAAEDSVLAAKDDAARAGAQAKVDKYQKQLSEYEKQLSAVEAANQSRQAKNRHAFMDYMACSLGSDTGTERYFKSLVHMSSLERGLIVHPEVARRLTRVQSDLQKQGLPMPKTTIGQSLRGDHTGGRKRVGAGMLTHAMGVAVDWFALKNPHFKDPRVRALIEAVTGRKPSMQLGDKPGEKELGPAYGRSGSVKQLVQELGEAAMGNGPTDPKAAAELERKRAILMERISKEYEQLKIASDAFEVSIEGDARGEIQKAHYDLIALEKDLAEKAKEFRKVSRAKKPDPAKVAPLQKAVEDAQKALAARREEVRKASATWFAPWIKKLEAKMKPMEDEAKAIGLEDLGKVTTAKGFEWKTGEVHAALGRGMPYALQILIGSGSSSQKQLADLSATIEAGEQALAAKPPKKATPEQITAWSTELAGLKARAAAASTRAHTLAEAARLLRGDDPQAASAGKAPKRLSFNGKGDVDRWAKALSGHETKVGALEKKLADTDAKIPEKAKELAKERRGAYEENEAIRKKLVTKYGDPKVADAKLAELQRLKTEWFPFKSAATSLVENVDFMFKPPDVRDPGAAQMLGLLPEGLPDRKGDYGGGGFFGTTSTGERAAAPGIQRGEDERGFGKLFFQTVAGYGFEIAAQWEEADIMHFEIDRLADMIVPSDACDPAPKMKTPDKQAAEDLKAAARIKAAGEQSERFVKEAESSKARLTQGQ